MARRVKVERRTKETIVRVDLDLDGSELREISVSTGVPFLDHMVETLAYYAGWGLRAAVEEVKRVDDHHVAEDLALALGEAVARAVASGGYRVARFGYAVVPMDEALVLVAVDYSGRPGAWVELPLRREAIGGLATENIPHFLQSLAAAAGMTLHVATLRGGNDHHVAEAAFKALGMALRQALAPGQGVVSTKGAILPPRS